MNVTQECFKRSLIVFCFMELSMDSLTRTNVIGGHMRMVLCSMSLSLRSAGMDDDMIHIPGSSK